MSPLVLLSSVFALSLSSIPHCMLMCGLADAKASKTSYFQFGRLFAYLGICISIFLLGKLIIGSIVFQLSLALIAIFVGGVYLKRGIELLINKKKTKSSKNQHSHCLMTGSKIENQKKSSLQFIEGFLLGLSPCMSLMALGLLLLNSNELPISIMMVLTFWLLTSSAFGLTHIFHRVVRNSKYSQKYLSPVLLIAFGLILILTRAPMISGADQLIGEKAASSILSLCGIHFN